MHFSPASLSVLFALVWIASAASDQPDVNSYYIQPKPVPVRLGRRYRAAQFRDIVTRRAPSVARRSDREKKFKDGITAHPDHGKTTLTEGYLRVQSTGYGDRVKTYDTMDNPPREKEKDLTISNSKVKKGKRWVNIAARADSRLRRRLIGNDFFLNRRTEPHSTEHHPTEHHPTEPHSDIRITGHVDHGKTTLTAGILRVPSMDHVHHGKGYNDIDNAPEEKERGITIDTSHPHVKNDKHKGAN